MGHEELTFKWPACCKRYFTLHWREILEWVHLMTACLFWEVKSFVVHWLTERSKNQQSSSCYPEVTSHLKLDTIFIVCYIFYVPNSNIPTGC